MGREAIVHVEIGQEAGEAKALLESHELILRGDLRRRFAKTKITNLSVQDDILTFACAGETVALHLGAKTAAAWAKAIATPPPSLASKLGVNAGKKAVLISACDDPILAEALDGATTKTHANAAMLIVRIDSSEDIETALAAHETAPNLPLWAIYPKGKSHAALDGLIREALRQGGLRDTKACAVSDRLTATRYNPT